MIVYQLGNSAAHDFIWAYLFRYPGLLVLHDAQVHQARALWLLHPLVTLLVIVGTANHYWLDAIVAGGLLGIALAVIRVPRRTATTARRPVGLAPVEEPALVGAGR